MWRLTSFPKNNLIQLTFWKDAPPQRLLERLFIRYPNKIIHIEGTYHPNA